MLMFPIKLYAIYNILKYIYLYSVLFIRKTSMLLLRNVALKKRYCFGVIPAIAVNKRKFGQPARYLVAFIKVTVLFVFAIRVFVVLLRVSNCIWKRLVVPFFFCFRPFPILLLILIGCNVN
ncbi:hypothetical protein GGTG_08654 [Gaeumannomyces tritici R3-111a-1]|uniref:Uncharacterized protein n=1 Tax=Gaeumannomyces tritici (strain R3-111a-1) TaxID=644352 RepID=J3P565_GAET3|nr:hypothetical protein GGTG_08654 [Gaeumannomyces tritici R3-111a-1]EJT74816.1 hypothetical protein GGTG_08654 [Gaeumannomyces tritici R3-111a-1]